MCEYCKTINAKVKREKKWRTVDEIIAEFDPKPMIVSGWWYCFWCYEEKYGVSEEE